MYEDRSEPLDAEISGWLAGTATPSWADQQRPDQATVTPLDDLLRYPPAARPTAALAALDARQLTALARIDLLALLDEQLNWLQSAKARVLAVIDEGDSTEQRLSQEAVSLALMVPGRSAEQQLKISRTLVDQLPNTLDLLSSGQISARHAEVIAEASWRLPPELLPRFEQLVTERAGEQTVPRLKQTVKRALIALDPATAQQRHERAAAERRIGFQPADDGMVELPVLLPAPQGQLIFSRLTAAAQLLPATDPRTIDQKRADLLVDAVLTGLPDGELPARQRRRPAIQVVVSADTLLNLDDEPAELVGYGPLTAETARRLAADESGTWRRLLTDPDTGHLLDVSPRRYRPSARLKDFVTARDGICAFPTCNQPGYRCDYDHIKPFGAGGSTCRCNGALACRRHNNCKINTGWSYRFNTDGTFTWTTDTGHSYTSHPPDWARPRPAPPPEPERRIAIAEIDAEIDAAYADNLQRWQHELDDAERSDDQDRAANARAAIGAIQQQRTRQQAHRNDPDLPPF
ncbi:MAG: DUF222 domain-containing protein [Jatrophihabitantaceae bacterium]